MSVAADKTGQCILVAEDSPTESLALRNILRYGGHEPIITRSGDEALKALGKNQVDLIISDINMPGMSGYELC